MGKRGWKWMLEPHLVEHASGSPPCRVFVSFSNGAKVAPDLDAVVRKAELAYGKEIRSCLCSVWEDGKCFQLASSVVDDEKDKRVLGELRSRLLEIFKWDSRHDEVLAAGAELEKIFMEFGPRFEWVVGDEDFRELLCEIADIYEVVKRRFRKSVVIPDSLRVLVKKLGGGDGFA